jgi:sugar phosphate isomerase/epimerase
MRLGAYVFPQNAGIESGRPDPEAYIAEVARKGYGACYTPDWLNADTDMAACKAFREAAAKNDIVIAEVGIWKNVLSKNPAEAKAAFDWSVRRLQTAEELGARCAVNTIGSWCAEAWDGPFPEGYSDDYFDAAVEAARKVIDAVKPKHTKMTFEVMPCQFIDSAKEYMRFLKAVDREGAGIHLDVTNSISNPRQLYDNAAYIRNEFAIYGDKIVSIHLKDLHLNPHKFTVNLDEVIIGRGNIDYINLLHLIDRLAPDTPGMLEHLETEAEYDEAAANLRGFAVEAGVKI